MRLGPPAFATAAVLAFALLSGCFKAAPSASNDLVSSSTYTRLLVEVNYVEGQKPRSTSIELLQQRTQERLSKPDGVEVVQRAIQSSKTSYTTNDIRAMEAQHRQNQPSGKTMVLYVLYLNGHHADDTSSGKVLGAQYGRASIAVFKESVDGSSAIPLINFNAADVEKAVLVHEFGHALGLVNNGLEMVTPREDSSHPRHSTNEESVMYWAIENTSGLPLLERIPNQFDANDIQDIRAAGGK